MQSLGYDLDLIAHLAPHVAGHVFELPAGACVAPEGV